MRILIKNVDWKNYKFILDSYYFEQNWKWSPNWTKISKILHSTPKRVVMNFTWKRIQNRLEMKSNVSTKQFTLQKQVSNPRMFPRADWEITKT